MRIRNLLAFVLVLFGGGAALTQTPAIEKIDRGVISLTIDETHAYVGIIVIIAVIITGMFLS